MSGMGTAMMGTGEASGERRAIMAAEEAISNPLLDDVSLRGAKGLLLSITGGRDLTLYEVDEAASRVRQEVDAEANIIVGATFDDSLGERVRVSIVASGMARLNEAAVSAPVTAPAQATAWPRVAAVEPPPARVEPAASYAPAAQPAPSPAAATPGRNPSRRPRTTRFSAGCRKPSSTVRVETPTARRCRATRSLPQATTPMTSRSLRRAKPGGRPETW
jgi:cell division protein FtsZ